MFLYPSSDEGLAWLEAGDEHWADRAVSAYAAAAERRENETAGDGTAS